LFTVGEKEVYKREGITIPNVRNLFNITVIRALKYFQCIKTLLFI
jgi:hypothetical protein